MSTHVINSDESFQRFMGEVRQQYAAHRFLRASLKTGKDRSGPQNNLTHAWYEQIARELREDDALGWKCYCKLHHGVPILRAEDAEFRQTYDSTIKGMGYEQKLTVMRLFPVTSLMTREQLSKYAEAVRDDFQCRGVFLEFPEGH
ncbi:hypothetical protein IMZ29_00920 [Achromobacter sp. GG226]|uniref:hypothetical protein n=1 Tax=Verticiella alkaliphila TaxID=2779529 RepID=UPI001C0D7781|nr:hypothetical protein [Verticiella sp. GG226]MBU4609165.1 hypothetical protein [Verticiella sp. GG226]